MSAGILAIETEIRIAAAPAAVWAILIAFDDYGAWNDYVPRIEGCAAAGAQIAVCTRDTASGHEMEQPCRVERLDPFVMHWVGGAEGQLRGDHFFELLPAGPNATLLRHHEHFSGSLAPAVLANYGEAIRRNFETFNACLKARAESAQP